MKFLPVSTFIVTTTLLLISSIGQQKVPFASAAISKSSPASAQFFQPIVPVTNDPFILMRFAFNKGKPSNETSYCTEEDYVNIIDVFPLDMQARRQLRSMATKDIVPSATTGRELYPPMCAAACAGFAPGTCRATRCVGYRRNLMMTTGDAPPMTEAGVNAICSSTMSLLHTNIDNLIASNQVSNTCKTFLAKPARETYCALCNPDSY